MFEEARDAVTSMSTCERMEGCEYVNSEPVHVVRRCIFSSTTVV